MSAPPPAHLWPLAMLAALVALGLAAHAFGLVDVRVALAGARAHAAQWWFPAALVALQVLLFTFGLPGSAVLWLAAPLYAPPAAAAILTAGGCLGALAAHALRAASPAPRSSGCRPAAAIASCSARAMSSCCARCGWRRAFRTR